MPVKIKKYIAFAMICIAFMSLLVICISAQEKGNISISTVPVNGKIYVNGVFVGIGNYTGEYEIRSYTISFGKVDGYYSPRNPEVAIVANDTIEILGKYEKIPNGTLYVMTTPVDADIYVDGGKVGKGLFEKVYPENTNLMISFGTVEGYYTPDEQEAIIIAEEVTTVTGNYKTIPKGTLHVVTNPVDGDIYIDGKKVGNGEFEDEYYENTKLKVSFGDVEGYYTPENREVVIEANKTKEITGNYTEIPKGWINVTTTSDDGIINGDMGTIYIDSEEKAVGSCNVSFPENTEHIIHFGEVEGYYAPEDRNETVSAYVVISIEGIYQRIQNGTVYVVTTSDDDEIKGDRGDIFIDHEKVGTGTCRLEYPENTNHTISFGDLEGYYTPEEQKIMVKAGEVIEIIGDKSQYKKIPTGTLHVVTKPVEGDIYVNGKKVGRGDFKKEYYENTTLTISFGVVGDAIEGYYTPDSVSVVIQPDKENLTEGVYRKIPKGTICIETITEDGNRLNGDIYIDGIFYGTGYYTAECRIDRTLTISFGNHTKYYDKNQEKPKYRNPSAVTVELNEYREKSVNGIYARIKYPPIAAIIPEAGEVALNNPIKFSAKRSSDIDGSIIRCIWDLDGYAAEGEEVTYTFKKGGLRHVKLTVYDSDGLSNTTSIKMNVKPEPTFTLSIDKTEFDNIDDYATLTVMVSSPFERPPIFASIQIEPSDSAVTISEPLFEVEDIGAGKTFKKAVTVKVSKGGNFFIELKGHYWFEGDKEHSKVIESNRVGPISVPEQPGGEINWMQIIGIIIGLFIIVAVLFYKLGNR